MLGLPKRFDVGRQLAFHGLPGGFGGLQPIVPGIGGRGVLFGAVRESESLSAIGLSEPSEG
jgi:hypothetical protein